VTGLPPLSGFIGKFVLLAAVPEGQAAWVWTRGAGDQPDGGGRAGRAGTLLFWRTGAGGCGEFGRNERPSAAPRTPPGEDPMTAGRSGNLQLAAVLLLLGYGVAMTAFAARCCAIPAQPPGRCLPPPS
jgi:multicomponent K+:H+ antiporter subunit D